MLVSAVHNSYQLRSKAHTKESAGHSSSCVCVTQVEGVFVSEAGLGRASGQRGSRLFGQQAESQEKTINKGERAISATFLTTPPLRP